MRVQAAKSGTTGSAEVSTSAVVPHWIAIARTYLSVREMPGLADNPKVVDFFLKSGHAEVRHDSTPWCAAFVGAVLRDAGLRGTGSLWALSYANWGQKLAGPAVGAVATKTRSGGGHVFFVAGFDATRIWGLGGNQSDQVCVAAFPRSVITAYRWPTEMPLPKTA